jgi:peptidyl-prolyl cis-trans isomerase B (cyclophilin B)
MNRFLALLLLGLFCFQNNALAERGEDSLRVSKAERRRALRIVEAQGGSRKSGETRVVIRTSKGRITVALYNETPLHRENFLRLVEGGEYDGILFHRVIPRFMIQAGDPASRYATATSVYGSGSIGERIPAEIRPTLFHHRGALAAARTADEANPDRLSSGSQFYIVQGKVENDPALDEAAAKLPWTMPEDHRTVYRTLGGTPHLDGQYTIFGRVTGGMRTIDRIASQPTDYANRPRQDIYIRSMTLKQKGIHLNLKRIWTKKGS